MPKLPQANIPAATHRTSPSLSPRATRPLIRCRDMPLLYSAARGRPGCAIGSLLARDIDPHLPTAAFKAPGGRQAAALDKAQHASILGIDLRHPGRYGLGARVGQQP